MYLVQHIKKNIAPRLPLHNLRRRGYCGYIGGDCYEISRRLQKEIGGEIITCKWTHDPTQYHWLLKKEEYYFDLATHNILHDQEWVNNNVIIEGNESDYWKSRPSVMDGTWVLKWWKDENTFIHLHHDFFEVNGVECNDSWHIKFGLIEEASGILLNL
jgi:hypothetical protein